jgi:hypothetical protein
MYSISIVILLKEREQNRAALAIHAFLSLSIFSVISPARREANRKHDNKPNKRGEGHDGTTRGRGAGGKMNKYMVGGIVGIC